MTRSETRHNPRRTRGAAIPLAPLRALPVIFALLAAGTASELHAANSWMFDQDENGIDDRLEDVALNGIKAAYENGDPDGRLRYEITPVGALLQYGGYVRMNHTPTPADSVSLTLLGAQVISRFQSVPYLRIRAGWPTILLIGQRPDVERVEAVSLMYSMNWRSRQLIGARTGALSGRTGLDGRTTRDGSGVVVALLDTGINDAPLGAWPGHEEVAGKVLGGAWYGGPGPVGYTWWGASVNPAQSTPGLPGYHATHLAGTVAGGGATSVYGGVAPGARLLDVKVLDDHGSGSGLAEGLEWCWQNRTRSWGGGYMGVQIVNVSLSGTDPSDGNDCICALINALSDAGVIVVASAGNDGDCGTISAPGAADGALTVGAFDPGAALDPDDDTLAPFSNEGPRTDDGDATHLDELKPDLVAPGIGIVSAEGAPLGTGHGYRAADGTSMAAALVTGALAVLRQADPGLTPAAARDLLRRTSRHRQTTTRACSAGSDPLSVDARYHAGWGFGELDLVAAWEERAHPDRTQFLALSGHAAPGGVQLEWTTQRERDLVGFALQRAPDVGGQPGAFDPLPVPNVPAMGYSDLGAGNRTTYLSVDPSAVSGRWWYRIVTTGGASVDLSPAARVDAEAPLAMMNAALRHRAPSSDLTLTVGAGVPNAPAFLRPIGIPFDPALVDIAPTGNGDDELALALRLPLAAADGAGALLPPSANAPWWLAAAEAGHPDRSGSLDDLRIVQGAATYVTAGPVPEATLEGGTVRLWLPSLPTSGTDEDPRLPAAPVAAPNPTRGDITLSFTLGQAGEVRLRLFDIAGRVVRDYGAERLGPGAHVLHPDLGNAAGTRLAAGRYLLRFDGPDGRRVLPVTLTH